MYTSTRPSFLCPTVWWELQISSFLESGTSNQFFWPSMYVTSLRASLSLSVVRLGPANIKNIYNPVIITQFVTTNISTGMSVNTVVLHVCRSAHYMLCLPLGGRNSISAAVWSWRYSALAMNGIPWWVKHVIDVVISWVKTLLVNAINFTHFKVGLRKQVIISPHLPPLVRLH